MKKKKKNAIFHFVYTLASTNFNQSAPNLVKIYIIVTSWMSSIMGLIGLKRLEVFTLRKIATFDFVYTLTSTINNQLTSHFVKIYMTIRSQMSSIMGIIGLELELFALELENLLYLTLFTL